MFFRTAMTHCFYFCFISRTLCKSASAFCGLIRTITCVAVFVILHSKTFNNLFFVLLLSFDFPIVTDSITLSGDERELGKVCVRVSYQEAVEQVWITLVQVRLHAVRRGEHEDTKSSIVLFCSISQWTLCVSRTQASVSSSHYAINFGSDTREEKVIFFKKRNCLHWCLSSVIRAFAEVWIHSKRPNTRDVCALYMISLFTVSGLQWRDMHWFL